MRVVIQLCLPLPFFISGARADWQQTKWGMPEQTVKAAMASVPPLPIFYLSMSRPLRLSSNTL
jgi:hypothetical protein